MRNQKIGGRGSLDIHESVKFKIRNDFSINSNNVESISADFIFENRNNTVFNVLYRQPNSQIEPFEKFSKETFSRIKSSNKQFHVASDLKYVKYDMKCKICRKV